MTNFNPNRFNDTEVCYLGKKYYGKPWDWIADRHPWYIRWILDESDYNLSNELTDKLEELIEDCSDDWGLQDENLHYWDWKDD